MQSVEKNWFWFAGKNEDDYSLAGPCETKEQAIKEAYGDVLPGQRIFLIEGEVVSQDGNSGQSIIFEETRNSHSIIRMHDEMDDPVEAVIEEMAQAIYEANITPAQKPWMTGGSFPGQSEARKSAKAAWIFLKKAQDSVLAKVSDNIVNLLEKNCDVGTYFHKNEGEDLSIDGSVNLTKLKADIERIADK